MPSAQLQSALCYSEGNTTIKTKKSFIKTILVIDDCEKSVQQIRTILEADYKVVHASNGLQALDTARENQPDLILLDVGGATQVGFNVCSRIKSLPETESTPIIFMADRLSDKAQDRAFGLGGVDVIDKPIRRVELQYRVYNQIKRLNSERLIKRQALYDGLTDLPNRGLSFDRLRNALLQDIRNQKSTALLFIDLDNFKTINDKLGHDAGDQLLIQAANRFRASVRQGDTVGRLGGDEFVIILQNLHHSDDAKAISDTILRAFSEPFRLSGVTQQVGTSIGVAISPDDSMDARQLMASADTAMYQAKQQGRGCIKFFSAMMNLDANRRVLLEHHLREAARLEELSLHYQPIFDLQTNQVIGAEALLRWQNPALGRVSPDEFIGQAEHSGLIWKIGEFVLRQACEDFRALKNLSGEPLRLCINISSQQMREPKFPSLVKSILLDCEFPPARLEIEVTENLLLNCCGAIKENIGTLRNMGVRFSLDDFGTGSFSLSYLTSHNFNMLKIDGLFIESMMQNDEHDGLVSAAIAIGHALKLDVVAEGVETEEQLAILKNKNCRYAQGNLLSPPKPLIEFQQNFLGPSIILS